MTVALAPTAPSAGVLTACRHLRCGSSKCGHFRVLPAWSERDRACWLLAREARGKFPQNKLALSPQQVHVTYPYASVMTFGGYRDDFMLVIRSIPDQGSGRSHIEKLIFRMAAPKVGLIWSEVGGGAWSQDRKLGLGQFSRRALPQIKLWRCLSLGL